MATKASRKRGAGRDLYRKVRRVDEARAAGVYAALADALNHQAHPPKGWKGTTGRAEWRRARRKALAGVAGRVERRG